MRTYDLGHRIRKAREERDMTQELLARSVGVSRTALSQMENGEKSRYNPDVLYRIATVLNMSVDDLLRPPPDRSESPHLDEMDIRISIPQNNKEKFKEILLYILNKVGGQPNIGKTVIYKLLYFIDFDYYETYGEQMIGATYIKNTYGPTPRQFLSIVDEMILKDELERVNSTHFDYDQTKYLPHRKPNLTVLNPLELEVAENVLKRLGGMNASQISVYSHGDVPWAATEDGKDIDYELVFYRTPLYSQREQEED
jgi:transcriptional regulator with XRE-family HTH domain